MKDTKNNCCSHPRPTRTTTKLSNVWIAIRSKKSLEHLNYHPRTIPDVECSFLLLLSGSNSRKAALKPGFFALRGGQLKEIVFGSNAFSSGDSHGVQSGKVQQVIMFRTKINGESYDQTNGSFDTSDFMSHDVKKIAKGHIDRPRRVKIRFFKHAVQENQARTIPKHTSTCSDQYSSWVRSDRMRSPPDSRPDNGQRGFSSLHRMSTSCF